MFNLKKEKKEMKTTVKNASSYTYENKAGEQVTNIDINLCENVALNADGKNESNLIRFRNKSVFIDSIISNIENITIYSEMQILKEEYTTNELCAVLCSLLSGAEIVATQNVITKDANGENLTHAYVDTKIDSIKLVKSGIKGYYVTLAKIENISDMEQIKAKINFALED